MFFLNDTATTEIYTYGHTLSLHDALPISWRGREGRDRLSPTRQTTRRRTPAPWLARSACDLAPAMWVVTLGQDRLRAWGAQRVGPRCRAAAGANPSRSEEHTSELQSLMRISYAVFCLKKKTYTNNSHIKHPTHNKPKRNIK